MYGMDGLPTKITAISEPATPTETPTATQSRMIQPRA